MVLKKIVPTLSQDIICYAKNNNNDKNFYDKIFKYYNETECQNIKIFLNTINNKKNIIYTFSSFYETIFDDDNDINNDNLKLKFNKKTTETYFIYNLKAEREIEDRINEFYKKNDNNLLIFHLTNQDWKH
jgi:hypothetical protein